MANKHQVIELHKKHPKWSSVEIAKELNCCDAYVRATFHRNGMTLPVYQNQMKEIYALGRAAKAAGLTLAKILDATT